MGHATPHPGDIVVHRQVHSPAIYVLSRFGAPLQYSCKTYDDAVARATEYARREHLDAWYTTDERIYERVAGHRASAKSES
jgi:hypothetical protein